MKDNFQDENSIPQKDADVGKDRRRFLKQMATCAVAVPLITVLPQMAVALTSGAGIPDPNPTIGSRTITRSGRGHSKANRNVTSDTTHPTKSRRWW